MRRITLSSGMRAARILRAHSVRLNVEALEDRVLPAVDPLSALVGFAQPLAEALTTALASPLGSPGGFSPAQIAQAYGFNQITFNNGSIRGDGSGQTIAIVDAYSQPNITSDLQTFDATFGLPAPPSFSVVNQNGGNSLPAADQSWGLEISLDVEWAHAIAPGANIVLVETNTNNYPDLMAGLNYARNLANVSVISLSWGGGEWSTESSYDSYFTTPAGHQGITFVAASGDTGSAGAPEYPSVSPNVLAVGGTQLSTDSSGNYLGEVAWSGSGGGISMAESQPSYQRGVVTQTSTYRAVPDVAYDGSSSTPFAVYDTTGYTGWIQVYGTSAGAPQWAALIAIANQGRALQGEGTLDGASQTLPTLYQLPQADFHDITSGNNGSYAATTGYDLVTGRGTPIANLIVAGLVGQAGSTPHNPPWLVTPANASSNVVTGTTTNLNAQGNDDSGAASLTYTWSVISEPTGAGNPVFSANGTNAAQNATVTFQSAGTYVFRVTITDPYGNSVSSNVTVAVNQVLSSIVVTPSAGSVYDGNTLHLTATAYDQFGHVMNVQPNWSWSLNGSGSLDNSGNFTAPSLGYGMSVVYVQADGLTQTATVSFQSSPFSLFPWQTSGNDPSQSWNTWLQFLNNWITQLETFWQTLLSSWSPPTSTTTAASPR